MSGTMASLSRLADLAEHYESGRMSFAEVRDLGDQVLALGALRVIGKGSGIAIEVPAALLATFRDGLITQLRDYGDESKALAAAGAGAVASENAEVVRRVIEANRSGSGEAGATAVTLADPNCVLTSRLTSVEGATYRGFEGIRTYLADMNDAWREWRIDLDELTELGPDAILTEVTFRATGHSGVEVKLHSAVAWLLAEGRVREMHSYPSREEALEAAGLSE